MVNSKSAKPLLVLRLYIAGTAPNSVRAVTNATALCQTHFPSRYELEIIDLLLHPRKGLEDGIIVTPTLLKLRPLPVQRVVGNLNDTTQLLLLLAGS